MLQILTHIQCIDNTGIKQLKCIGILNKKKSIKIGDIFIGAVLRVKPNINIKRGNIVKALLVKTSKKKKIHTGQYTFSNLNGAIILNSKNKAEGTRISGAISRELFYTFPSILTMADSTY